MEKKFKRDDSERARGGVGGRVFAREEGGSLLSAADGRVYTDRRWQGGGSKGGGVVT